MKCTIPLLGLMIALVSIPSVMADEAPQAPYPMDGYIVDKAGNTLCGANVTFTNLNTSEVIYADSDPTYGWYSQDAGNFTTAYADGQIIAYMVNYSGTTYQNMSYSFVINTSEGSNTANITLDQAPSIPTAFTDLGMNLIDHTPTITWTKGSDADSGDPVTTYVYVGNTSTPTVEEGNNTGTTLDLGSTVSLSDGITYYYRLRSYDGERWSDYTTADQFRMNSIPNVSNVQISPATAYTDTDLTGSGTYADAEGDAESGSTYKWFKNGVELAGQTTISLANSQFESGDEIIFQYTPNDGYEVGTPMNSSVKTISNSIPTVPTTLNLTSTIYVETTLTATGSGSTDADTGDGDTLTYYYQFKDGATELQAYSTDNTYVIPQGEAHDTITINCKVNDGVTYSDVKSADKSVSDTIPTTPTGSSIAGTTSYVGDTLTVTGAGTTDADGDVVSYQYEFRRGGASGTIIQALSGTNTYTLQTADAHNTIYVSVYGRAYSVNSNAHETVNRVVTNSVPVLASIGDKSGNVQVQITVDADATDADSDTQTYSCNRTDLFSDFSTSSGLGHWTPSYAQAGTYYVDFGVSDGYGGVDNETITITVNSVTFNITLPSSWSIIGWTNQTTSTAHAVGTSIGANCTFVSEYNATTGYYTTHNMGGPESTNSFMAERGYGYWVKTTAETLWARNMDSGAYNITLPSSWSIIGWTNQTAITAHAVGTSIGANCTFVSEYNATTGYYTTHNMGGPESTNSFMVEQGQGYWVKTTAETLWERDS